jgi:catechol 2,3-dioxygenase-like lactoylglutathione lyase family enzyme
MPTRIRLATIGTIMLGVRHLESSLAFYRDKLGLEVRMKMDDVALLAAGGVTLGLIARNPLPPAGAAEIVFQVPDVRAAYAGLQAQGVSFLNQPHQITPGDWAAHFKDLDGHLLSIFGPEGRA